MTLTVLEGVTIYLVPATLTDDPAALPL